eukprot:CAMPEP_0168760226 /NCGR_PEP_ID=MMETSP0724-20121128/22646_1 /TAXON_ID=265536 /ORGANISM="Amphiprora sp., Strain CCMP467" /LENGTH=267 /DNA_ID=CAMNT_0008809207 /DNA_START=72 /DNA_END=875 /DNA_ORIENTATION=-
MSDQPGSCPTSQLYAEASDVYAKSFNGIGLTHDSTWCEVAVRNNPVSAMHPNNPMLGVMGGVVNGMGNWFMAMASQERAEHQKEREAERQERRRNQEAQRQVRDAERQERERREQAQRRELERHYAERQELLSMHNDIRSIQADTGFLVSTVNQRLGLRRASALENAQETNLSDRFNSVAHQSPMTVNAGPAAVEATPDTDPMAPSLEPAALPFALAVEDNNEPTASQSEEAVALSPTYGTTKLGNPCMNCKRKGGYCHQHKSQAPN